MPRLPFDPSKTAAARAAQKKSSKNFSDFLPNQTDSATPNEPPLRSVKQVNAMVNQTLLAHLPGALRVQGEISNFRTYDRGHAFFTLKEPGAELPCVMWRDALARLKFKPADGLEVIASGSIKMYEPQGKVQLYVESLSPRGTGSLELAFRQLCDKLRAEGLFDPARKRPIVRLPQHVAIITSRTGDVLHDVLTTAYRRYPGLHVMLYPVLVQGDGAAPSIVNAIEDINDQADDLGGVDLILLVRGGGSLEDLWAFNEESLARAIVASRIPIATGIGHEPDTTIADLVGDLRGPTPTGVTELTIPDVAVLRRELDGHMLRLAREVRRQHDSARASLRQLSLEMAQVMHSSLRRNGTMLESLAREVARIEPRHAIAQGWRRIDEAQRNLRDAQLNRHRSEHDRLTRLAWLLEKADPRAAIVRGQSLTDQLSHKLTGAMRARLRLESERLAGRERQLKLVGPQSVLERGYSITMNDRGQVVRRVADVNKGDKLTTKVADGDIISTVGQPKQASLF